MAEGFLGRWSQRKQAVREGKPAPDPVSYAAPIAGKAAPVTPEKGPVPPGTRRLQPAADERNIDASTPATEPAQPAPPSMQDVAALKADSDFKPFIARAVAPEVRNAAMKKLFADPHFNVMDGLDIYIDDYSIPDPLPAAMLRKMASAQFLKLFDEEEDPARMGTGPVSPMGDAPVLAQTEPVETHDPTTPDVPESDVSDANSSDANAATTPATDPEKTDPTV